MQGTCLKCKQPQEMQNAVQEMTKRNKPIVKGTCPVCNGKMARLGRLEAN